LKRWVLSRHDSQDLIERIRKKLAIELELPHSSQVQCAEPDEGTIFATLESKYTFILAGEEVVPFLGSLTALSLFPSVRVDEGAIKFILNGADVMRPGIRRFDAWGGVGRVVVVREEKKDRGIAVASSLVESGEMHRLERGPCLKSLHHLGDRFWNLYKLV